MSMIFSLFLVLFLSVAPTMSAAQVTREIKLEKTEGGFKCSYKSAGWTTPFFVERDSIPGEMAKYLDGKKVVTALMLEHRMSALMVRLYGKIVYVERDGFLIQTGPHDGNILVKIFTVDDGRLQRRVGQLYKGDRMMILTFDHLGNHAVPAFR